MKYKVGDIIHYDGIYRVIEIKMWHNELHYLLEPIPNYYQWNNKITPACLHLEPVDTFDFNPKAKLLTNKEKLELL